MSDVAGPIDIARSCRRGGALAEALESYRDAMRAEPDSAAIAHEAGSTAYELGDYRIAEKFFAAALQTDPQHVSARILRSHALARLNRMMEAREEMQRALTIVPDFTDGYLSLGRLHHALLEYDEAAAAFERVIEANPRDSITWAALGESLSLSYTRYDEAMGALGKALELAPDDEETLSTVSDRYFVDGQFEAARAILRKLLSISNNVSAHPSRLRALALSLKVQGRAAEAQLAYEAALKMCDKVLEPASAINSIVLRGFSAFILMSMGCEEEARRIYNLMGTSVSAQHFHYDHEGYLADSYARVERLTELVRGRDVALLLYGPSIADLEPRLEELRHLDICFAGVNKFDPVEQRLLAPIGREFDILVTANPMDLVHRWDAFYDYVNRPGDNMLVTTDYALVGLRPPYSVDGHFKKTFDSKLLFFDPNSQIPPTPATPLHLPPGNTLSVALPLLALGGPRRIFIFGADGGAEPPHAKGGDLYFFNKPPAEGKDARRVQEGLRRLRNDAIICDDHAPFSIMAISALFQRPPPQIYNCCPHSNYRAFEKIPAERAIDLLRA